MAPSVRPCDAGLCLEEDETPCGVQKAERKVMEGWGPAVHAQRRTLRSWNPLVVGGDGEALGVYKVCVCVSQQIRKPLVEKKRRARINESLQELRALLADTEVRTEPVPSPPHCSHLTGSEGSHLTLPTGSLQDGERRGAGDDREEGGGHSEEPDPRSDLSPAAGASSELRKHAARPSAKTGGSTHQS